MTIKRRLFISNILILVAPILLTIFTSAFLLVIYMNTASAEAFDSLKSRGTFNNAVSEVSRLSENWTESTDRAEIRTAVDSFNNDRDNSTRLLYVYEGSIPLFPDLEISDGNLADTILSAGGETVIIKNAAAFYTLKRGSLTLILIDTDHTVADLKDGRQNNYLWIGAFAFLIIAVVITSRLLTTSVFRSIVKPIDVLIDGVHQIRDGNLSYRIEYNGEDEFAGICSDFNEMAQRLLESVETRQRDDANRKELIAGISHDLRTPLTSIKAYLEGIEKGVAATPQIQARYLNTIKLKTAELEQIINQLFLFSKIDIGEYPFRLEKTDIVGDLAEFTDSAAEEYDQSGLNINLSCPDGKLYVNIDKTQFHNVLTNIIGNSVKYKTKARGRMDITCTAADGKVVLELKDDGGGVPEESLSKLFNVFYRCDPSRSSRENLGSGLGLAIAAKIIERFGGAIAAKNAEGGGLAVIITLPVAPEEGVV